MDHLVRNGDGDELLFVHAGAGDLFCDFGHLSYRDGDYIVLPRGTMWRIETSSPDDNSDDRGDGACLPVARQGRCRRACDFRSRHARCPRYRRPFYFATGGNGLAPQAQAARRAQHNQLPLQSPRCGRLERGRSCQCVSTGAIFAR